MGLKTKVSLFNTLKKLILFSASFGFPRCDWNRKKERLGFYSKRHRGNM